MAARQPHWHHAVPHGHLAAALRLAVENGQHAFTAQDLRQSCTAWIEAQLPADTRRWLHHAVNERRSGRAIAGLTLLLALCGWITGGDEGAKLAVVGALPASRGPQASRDAMRRRGDALRLWPADAPELFDHMHGVCRRAGLRHMPDVYLLPAERSMNAYALGTPDDAVITLTGGLLAGMTRNEVTAIIAHEIAHICNNDASTMALAAELHRSVRLVSAAGLAAMAARTQMPLPLPLLARLLQTAPAISELLCLALSRIRELAADAVALDLISDPRALASALKKLEHHHRSLGRASAFPADDDLTGYLRSHPSTDQRVGFLHVLA
jgi:heat shock protein HtpX